MLRKILLTSLLVLFATAAFAGGQLDQEIPQQAIAHMTADQGDGMSPEVLAALIAGGLGLTGVVITAVVSINNRRKRT